METFECSHNPKKSRMVFSCQVSGDYRLVLCDDCYKNESRDFLISEMDIDFSEASQTSEDKENSN